MDNGEQWDFELDMSGQDFELDMSGQDFGLWWIGLPARHLDNYSDESSQNDRSSIVRRWILDDVVPQQRVRELNWRIQELEAVIEKSNDEDTK